MSATLAPSYDVTFETFLKGSGADPRAREVLWGLLAQAMRANPTARDVSLAEFLGPFSVFLPEAGLEAGEIALVVEALRHGRFLLPFGQMLVVDGTVKEVEPDQGFGDPAPPSGFAEVDYFD